MKQTELVELQILVRHSPETNDHEVCLFGNGENLIGRFDNCMMGLDPDDILIDPCPLTAGNEPRMTTIARCGCGVVSCGSVEVEIERRGDSIWWTGVHSSTQIRFDAAQYHTEVTGALSDRSWETPERTAARLIGKRVNRIALEARGFRYAWASGRCREGMMTVSLFTVPGDHQVLVSEPWEGEEIESIVDRVVHTLAQDPSSWPNAERYGFLHPSLSAGLEPPHS